MNTITLQSNDTTETFNPTDEQMEVISRILNNKPRMILTKEYVLEGVSEYTDISEAKLKSKIRRAEYVYPRHLYCYLCTKLTGASLKAIGAYINRDHTSVVHARDKIRGYTERYSYVKQDIENIMALLKGAKVQPGVLFTTKPSKPPKIKVDIPAYTPDPPKVIVRPPAVYSNRNYSDSTNII